MRGWDTKTSAACARYPHESSCHVAVAKMSCAQRRRVAGKQAIDGQGMRELRPIIQIWGRRWELITQKRLLKERRL
jgi:hypothetical protein